MNYKEKYSLEYQEINNLIKNLKKNYVYENTGVKMHGSLHDNMVKLEEYIFDLFDKIANNSQSKMELLVSQNSEALNNLKITNTEDE